MYDNRDVDDGTDEMKFSPTKVIRAQISCYHSLQLQAVVTRLLLYYGRLLPLSRIGHAMAMDATRWTSFKQ